MTKGLCTHCGCYGFCLADCPTRANEVTGSGPTLADCPTRRTLDIGNVSSAFRDVFRDAPPVNGVHFIGWDQHARRGRPSEAEDTIERLGSW